MLFVAFLTMFVEQNTWGQTQQKEEQGNGIDKPRPEPAAFNLKFVEPFYNKSSAIFNKLSLNQLVSMIV